MESTEKHMENDKLVKEFFESFGPLEPSDEFTKRTMNIVLQEWVSQPQVLNTKVSVRSKVWIGVSVVLAGILIYLFDVKQIGTKDSMFGIYELQESFIQLMRSSLSEFAHVPSVVYFVVAAIIMLLVIDKMINSLVKS
ncbi:hypothetical protein [Saccharicrinis fermentans]|uniref:Uncharacterized protein n=1 Tax=Saccharicrinis fermentans DSM 9555 = JCM 21142 TaxID=869213 RepID=W7YLZ7_9BACT|nr:hypothetical protein [Saccharicrinis fermentans]GAF05681.1 hypothetical protein JCM21142_104426 [Saccharicrinis fermentans DSM 9555 = JCM 21142]